MCPRDPAADYAIPGRCSCQSGDRCPFGRTGAQERCTVRELRAEMRRRRITTPGRPTADECRTILLSFPVLPEPDDE